jgi:hypothetical protein
MSKWVKIVFADDLPDCPDCEEKWCARHKKHYADCACLGPTQGDVEYRQIRGALYGRKKCKRSRTG